MTFSFPPLSQLKQKACSAVIWQKRAASGSHSWEVTGKMDMENEFSQKDTLWLMVKVCLWLAAILAINIWDMEAVETWSEIGITGLSLQSLSISASNPVNDKSDP